MINIKNKIKFLKEKEKEKSIKNDNEIEKIINEFLGKCQTLLKIDLGNTKITIDGLQFIVEGVTNNDSIKEIIAENNPMLDKLKAVNLFKFKEQFLAKVTICPHEFGCNSQLAQKLTFWPINSD